MEPGVIFLLLIIAAKVIEAVAGAGKRQGGKGPAGQRQRGGGPESRPRESARRLPPEPDRPALPGGSDDEPAFRDVDGWNSEWGEPADDRAGTAADMVPEDLWAILTGQPLPERAPPAPKPPPAPAPKPVPRPTSGSEAPRPVKMKRREGVQARTLPPVQTRPRSSEPLSGRGERAGLPTRVPSYKPERVESYDDQVARAEYVPVHEPPQIVSLEELEIDDEARRQRFHRRLEETRSQPSVQSRRSAAFRFRSDEDLRRAIVMAEVLGRPKGLE